MLCGTAPTNAAVPQLFSNSDSAGFDSLQFNNISYLPINYYKLKLKYMLSFIAFIFIYVLIYTFINVSVYIKVKTKI